MHDQEIVHTETGASTAATIRLSFSNASGFFALIFSILSLFAIILVQNLQPGERLPPLAVGLAALILLATARIKFGFLKLVWPLLGVLLLGILGSLDHERMDVLRDVAYALTPIALIYIGYWMAGNKAMWPLIMKIMVSFGVLLAALHLSNFVQNPSLITADLVTVRKEAGSTGAMVVLPLVLGLLQHRLGIGTLFPKYLPRPLVMPLLLASFILSYSRTALLMFMILTLALSGLLSRVSFRSIVTVCLIVFGLGLLIATTPEDDDKSFRGKLRRSATEVAVDDFGNLKDIQANWRGFEAFRALDSFAQAEMLQKAVGQGAGALVDLGFVMKLDTESYRYIPILHNGYAYILVKTGIFGIICYLLFYLNTIRSALSMANSRNPHQVFFSRLMLGTVVCLALSMFVVGGMAEVHDAEFVLLLGFLSRRTIQGISRQTKIRKNSRRKRAASLKETRGPQCETRGTE